MKYRELYNEYRELLDCEIKLRQELHQIPRGYLVTKKIAGNEYLYLQYTLCGKKKSEYIREEEREHIKAAVAKREPMRKKLDALRCEQSRLESAAKILDSNLYRTFSYLKQCAEMDSLPKEKRADVLSFAKAMTGLEGLPTKEETENNLLLWAKGEKKFMDFYMKSLQNYNVVEGV